MFWVLCAGRGFGKTFSGSNVLVEEALAHVGDYAAIGPTFGDAKKIMAAGPSGLLVAAGSDVASFNQADYIIFLRNGSRIVLASADVPDRLRGWNLRMAWVDELGSYGPRARELWDAVLLPALRIGEHPRAVITTTPRRGNTVLVDLLARAERGDPTVHVTRGRTADNKANLSDTFVETIYARFAGSALGAQELDGILLEDVPGALVDTELIEVTRVQPDQTPELRYVVTGVDPAVSNTEYSDATGIVVVGIGPAPSGWQPPSGALMVTGQPHLYLLQDASLKASPEGWARRALQVADDWAAEAIIAESNQGGQMVESTLRMVADGSGLHIPRITLVHASRGKVARAEPMAAAWAQHRVHVVARLPELETEWTTYVQGETSKSPDRLDASVWAAVGALPQLGMRTPTMVKVLNSGLR